MLLVFGAELVVVVEVVLTCCCSCFFSSPPNQQSTETRERERGGGREEQRWRLPLFHISLVFIIYYYENYISILTVVVFNEWLL
jgi:hypothetical protein